MKSHMGLLKIVAFAVFFFNSPAKAEHITGEIKRIYPNKNKVFFRLKNDACISGSQYYYFTMSEADDSGKYAAQNWYSMLLASAVSSKPVSVKVESCPVDGHIEINYMYQDY